MKKLIIMTVSLSSLLLFSFTSSSPNDKPKIKVRLIKPKPYPAYSVENGDGMSDKDLASSNAIISKVYGVTDFDDVKTMKYIRSGEVKNAIWVVRNEIKTESKFTKRTIAGDDKVSAINLSSDLKELIAIYDKYVTKEKN
jgi:hypothetical protein